jgi:hypothetical protein
MQIEPSTLVQAKTLYCCADLTTLHLCRLDPSTLYTHMSTMLLHPVMLQTKRHPMPLQAYPPCRGRRNPSALTIHHTVAEKTRTDFTNRAHTKATVRFTTNTPLDAQAYVCVQAHPSKIYNVNACLRV